MGKESGRKTDPLLVYQFGLEVQGQVTGYFGEISGVGSEHEVVEHKVVDDKGHEVIQKIPGRLKWGDITLKRGVTDDMQIWGWRQMVEDGEIGKARKNGTITAYDRNYKALARWSFINGWPSKVTGPSFKADSNELSIEEVVLVHEGLKREKV